MCTKFFSDGDIHAYFNPYHRITSYNVCYTKLLRYNDAKYGGFETRDYVEQSTPPGMVFIEGGTFTLGRTIEDLPGDWNNMQRRVTVNSFYMDQHEISIV